MNWRSMPVDSTSGSADFAICWRGNQPTIPSDGAYRLTIIENDFTPPCSAVRSFLRETKSAQPSVELSAGSSCAYEKSVTARLSPASRQRVRLLHTKPPSPLAQRQTHAHHCLTPLEVFASEL